MDRRVAAYNEARLAYEECAREAAQRGWKGFATMTTTDTALAARDPRLERAAALYKEALESTREERAYRDLGIAWYQLGMLEHFRGAFSAAEQNFREAQSILESLPQLATEDVKTISGCCYHLGILAARRGALQIGRGLLKRSEALDEAMVDLSGQAMNREALAHFGGE
jgi:tetratricopeptide (TPR) repeat protein